MNDGTEKNLNEISKFSIDQLNGVLQYYHTEGILVISANGYFTYATEAAQNIIGYTQNEFELLRFVDLVQTRGGTSITEIFSNVRKISTCQDITNIQMRLSNGSVKSFEGSLVNKLDDPLIKGIVFTFREIKKYNINIEKADLSSKTNFFVDELFNRCVVASLSDQVAVLSNDGTILAVNRAWEAFAEEIGADSPKNADVGSNYLAVCTTAINDGDEEVRKTVDGILSVFNKKAPSYHQEYPCFTPTMQKWFVLNVVPFGGDDSKVVITHQDITSRKVAEDNLKFTAEKLKTTLSNLTAILDSSLDLICTVNSKMEFETVNKASLNILGFLPEELIGTVFIDLVYKDDIERTHNAAENIYAGSPEYLFENRYVHKSGKIVSLLWSVIWDDTLQLMYCVAKDITESNKLQKSIEIERGHYYDMFLQAPSAVVMLKGENHIYKLANPLYLTLVGKTDIIGKSVAEILPEVEDQGFIKMLDSVYQTGKSISGAEVLIKLDRLGTGELVDTYLNFIFQSYRNLAGEIEGVFFFANDVTEQILTRNMVEKSEKFFKGVIESSHDLLATISETGKILYTSPAVSKVYGYCAEEISKMNILDVMHPEDEEISLAFFEKVLLQPALPLSCSAVRQRRKDGSYIWIEATLTNFLATDGINSIVANFRNITERKISESLLQDTLTKLEEEKTRLLNAQKVAKIGSWQINARTFETSWSAETFYILGVDPLSFKASYKAFLNFIHPEDRELVDENFLETLSNSATNSIEHRIISFEGITKWVEEKWTINRDSDGDVIIVNGTCQDITDRKVAEDKILQSETKLKVAQHIAQVGSWEFDLRLGELSWSDEFYRILEIEKNIIPSSESFYKYIHHDDRDMVVSAFATAEKLENSSVLFRFIRKNGIIGYASSEWKVDYGVNGQARQIYGILRDLTDEYKAEKERQKMVVDIIRRNKDLEQFSYIISHNLRSPVANILGLTEELRDKSHSPETVVELMEAISSDVKRLEEVIVDLNMIVQTKRDIVERKEEVVLSQLVDNILLSINFLIENKNVKIKPNFKVVDTVWTIKSYMQSIFYNIISNSIKYRQNDRELVLEIETAIVDKKLNIVFRDNGVGIDLERYSPYMFGLYKRFHSGTEGKGLGLYMVKTQVNTLGGAISVKSEVNIGTEFTIEFEHHT